MDEALEKFLMAWIPLFVAMDPVGLVPIFLGITRGLDAERRRKIAHQATITAGVVAVGFMFLGRFVFQALGITESDFQIAGGIILFALATRDLLGQPEKTTVTLEDVGVVPLGLPLITGPATLAAVLLLMETVGIAVTLLALLVNLLLVAWGFRCSERLVRWIGLPGLRAVSKIIALLLAAIAVNMVQRGWQQMAGAMRL